MLRNPAQGPLPEIVQIERLLEDFHSLARGKILGYIDGGSHRYPLYKISVGSEDPQAPVLGWVGGVHGLERIGAQVVLSLLTSMLRMQLWDESLQNLLSRVRLFFIPTVNPWGLHHRRRSNAQGVDLMRNSPVEAQGPVPRWIGGHRFSPRLPWYRGLEYQVENQLLENAILEETRQSPFAWTVDVHSGFGFQDQIWFPYAKSLEPFPDVAYIYRFKTLLESAHPYHVYKIEPQSYRTHGDMWDYLYLKVRRDSRLYLPLTLELGSWNWLKKNPLQIFTREGLFHPLKPHRHRRILRRHWTLFDFMLRMTASPKTWLDLDPSQKEAARRSALELWYDKG